MPAATRILTSRTIKRSGWKPNSFRAVACDKLLGYPSKSQPFSWESGCSRRSFTIYKIRWLNEQYECLERKGSEGGGRGVFTPCLPYHDNYFIWDQLSFLHVFLCSLPIFTPWSNFCPQQVSSSNMHQTILHLWGWLVESVFSSPAIANWEIKQKML